MLRVWSCNYLLITKMLQRLLSDVIFRFGLYSTEIKRGNNYTFYNSSYKVSNCLLKGVLVVSSTW